MNNYKVGSYIRSFLGFIYNLFAGSFKNAMIFSGTLVFFKAYIDYEKLREEALNIDSALMQNHIVLITLTAFLITLFLNLKGPTAASILWFKEKIKNGTFAAKFFLVVLAVSLMTFFGISTLKAHYIVGLDFRDIRCLDGHVYVIRKNTFTDKDIYVAFLADKRFPPYVDEGKIVFKKIVGRAGDQVETIDRKIYLNGEYICEAREKDSKGRPIGHFDYTGQIPENCYFVMGSHPISFDSRYYGFVTKNQIVGGGNPVW